MVFGMGGTSGAALAVRLALATSFVFIALTATDAAAAKCSPGTASSVDTSGACCWPGQAAGPDRVCVGVPDACPDGFLVDEKSQTCVATTCLPGMVRASKKTPCCFPGQAWSQSKGQCLGRPRSCPDGLTKDRSTCRVSAAIAANAATCEAPSSAPAAAAEACFEAGLAYARGDGTPQNPPRGWHFYRRACQKGRTDGCTNMGAYYEIGTGVARDLDRARQLYESGCQAGDPQGCWLLGGLYGNGTGVTADLPRARALQKQACTGANGPRGWAGCTSLAWMVEQGRGGAKDPSNARAILQAACSRRPGDEGSVCGAYGLMLLAGRGGPADKPRGIGLVADACEAGAVGYCSSAGYYLSIGGGWVAPDPARGRRAYESVCTERGGGCDMLAILRALGEGGPRDFPGARRAVAMACPRDASTCLPGLVVALESKPTAATLGKVRALCEQERPNVWACSLAAHAMSREVGGPAQPEVVRALLARSCVGPEWCFMAGDELARVGDATRARVAFDQACRNGHGPACARRSALDTAAAQAALQNDRTMCQRGSADHCYAMAERNRSGGALTSAGRGYLERSCSLQQASSTQSYKGQRACTELAALRRAEAAAAAQRARIETLRQQREEEERRREAEKLEREAERERERAAEEERKRQEEDKRMARIWREDAADHDRSARKHRIHALLFGTGIVAGAVGIYVALTVTDNNFARLMLSLPGLGVGSFCAGQVGAELSRAKRDSTEAEQSRSYVIAPIVTPDRVGVAAAWAF